MSQLLLAAGRIVEPNHQRVGIALFVMNRSERRIGKLEVATEAAAGRRCTLVQVALLGLGGEREDGFRGEGNTIHIQFRSRVRLDKPEGNQ